jgi:hypothetical protein
MTWHAYYNAPRADMLTICTLTADPVSEEPVVNNVNRITTH